MAINFVSASFHYGGYSLSDILNTFDPSTVFLLTIFIIAFILIFWPLSKFFKESPSLAGIIAFVMSGSLIFEVNRRGFNFSGFFYNLGISEGILFTVMPLVLIIGIIFSGFKYGWGITLASIGGLLIGASFTDIIYSKVTAVTLGLILLGIGGWLWKRKRNRSPAGHFSRALSQNYNNYPNPSSSPNSPSSRNYNNYPHPQPQPPPIKKRKLQKKYDNYRSAAEAIIKKVGHIPKKGTPEYKQWANYVNAVKAVEKVASKQGFRLK